MPSRGLVLDRLEARSARCAVITVTKNAVFTVTSGDVGSKETNMTITSTEGARVIFAFVGADAREPMTVRGRLADAAERELAHKPRRGSGWSIEPDSRLPTEFYFISNL